MSRLFFKFSDWCPLLDPLVCCDSKASAAANSVGFLPDVAREETKNFCGFSASGETENSSFEQNLPPRPEVSPTAQKVAFTILLKLLGLQSSKNTAHHGYGKFYISFNRYEECNSSKTKSPNASRRN